MEKKMKVKWELFDNSSWGDSPDGFVDNWVYDPHCPNCDKYLYTRNVERCPKCSTLLDWSE